MVLNGKIAMTYVLELELKMMTLYLTKQKKPNSSKKKILCAIIDKNLSLIHILCMCKKAAQILVVLNRISPLLDPEKKKLVFHAVIKSHFSYCPLIRMFSS